MIGKYSWLLAFPVLWFLLLPPMASAENESLPGLEKLIGIALSENPELQAAEARARSFESKVVPAGSLNDPALSLALSNYPIDTFSDNQTPMTGKIIRLTQELPFPGKLAAREEVATEQARWYRALAEESRLQLVKGVKEAYYNYYYFDRAVAITGKNLGILDDFIRLTESSYSVGKGLQQDVLKAQVERSRLLDRLYTIRQQRETALAALNRLANRDPDAPLAELPEILPVASGQTPEELRSIAASDRPMVAAYNSLVERYRAQKKLARLDYRPDFKVGLAYTQREPSGSDPGTDFAGVEFGFNLPVWRAKRSAAVTEAQSGEEMALAQYRDFLNQVAFNIQDAWSQLKTSVDQANLYKTGIIPQAAQALESARGAYQVGRLGFLPLLDNLMLLYNYELQYQKVLSDGQRSLARLEAESGRPSDPVSE